MDAGPITIHAVHLCKSAAKREAKRAQDTASPQVRQDPNHVVNRAERCLRFIVEGGGEPQNISINSHDLLEVGRGTVTEHIEFFFKHSDFAKNVGGIIDIRFLNLNSSAGNFKKVNVLDPSKYLAGVCLIDDLVGFIKVNEDGSYEGGRSNTQEKVALLVFEKPLSPRRSLEAVELELSDNNRRRRTPATTLSARTARRTSRTA